MTSRGRDRIQLRRPEGKRAPSVERARYHLVRSLMLAMVPVKEPGITWVQVRSAMDRSLGKQLEGVGASPHRLVRPGRGR